MEFLGLCGASVLFAALYRLAAIYNAHDQLLTRRSVIALVAFQLGLAAPTLAVGSFAGVDATVNQPKFVNETLQVRWMLGENSVFTFLLGSVDGDFMLSFRQVHVAQDILKCRKLFVISPEESALFWCTAS